jgi:hypothetical protein
MKDAPKLDHFSFRRLVDDLHDGLFAIPDFQREFEWNPRDIRELIRSIFQDYYIGSLLLWSGKQESFDALSCEPIYGYKGEGKPRYIVIDGQQRLTAIYYAFVAPDKPLPNRTNRFFYFIYIDKFIAEEYDEAFGYDWMTHRWDNVLNDCKAQYERHIFPLSIMGHGGWDIGHWVDGYRQFWLEQAKQAESSEDRSTYKASTQHAVNAEIFRKLLKDISEKYQISYIELDIDMGVDKVCDIFTRINSRGIRLDVFDLINALLKPKGLQLKQMWRHRKAPHQRTARSTTTTSGVGHGYRGN